MWTVVYMSDNKEAVEKLRRILTEKQIIVRIRPINQDSGGGCYEVLVPQTEVDEAQDLIIEEEFH